MKKTVVRRITANTFTTTGFQMISTYNKAEITEIVQFASSHLKGDDQQNAAYILGDVLFYPDKCQIATIRKSSNNDLAAIVLHMKKYYLPLGNREAAFYGLAKLLNLNSFFIRIPHKWKITFQECIPFSDSIENIAFELHDKESFQFYPPPLELRVKIADFKEDQVSMAKYYEKDIEYMIMTAKSHLRVFGTVNGNMVSVARANAVTSNYVVLGGVHTLHSYRGRGYGKAVVSKWTEEILSRGLCPILETDINNKPALAIYQGLGYSEIGRTVFYSKNLSIISRIRNRV